MLRKARVPDESFAAQRRDLREMRLATDARQALTRGTREYARALERERLAIERVWTWAEAGWGSRPFGDAIDADTKLDMSAEGDDGGVYGG